VTHGQLATVELESSTALFAIAAPDSAIGEFMWMPGGRQRISCFKDGQTKPVSADVEVNAGSARAIQQQLEALQAKSAHRPYFDFNHDDGPASFWPEGFAWKEAPAPGIYARGEWSDEGRKAIEGKTYRTFSPVFHVDNEKAKPARIVCNPNARLNLGGLVNDPAFKSNLPFFAKHASELETSNPSIDPTMKQTLAELQAKLTNFEAEITALKAKAGTDTEAGLQAKEAQVALLREQIRSTELSAKNEELNGKITKQLERQADAAIATAVARGAIPAKDDALKAKWKAILVEDMENEVLLAAQPGNAALQARHTQSISTGSGSALVRESSVSVLKKYGEERDPRARGAFYAKEIRPRLKEGDDLPFDGVELSGANSVGTLAGTLVTQRTLELFRLQFPILSRISTDFTAELGKFNQPVMSRIVTVPTVQVYDAVNGWTDANAVTTDVPVTIDKHVGVPITFNSNTLGSTVRRLFDETAPAASYALAKYVVDALYALFTAANYTTAAQVAALIDFAKATLTLMGATLNPLGVPLMGRSILLNSPYYGQLSNDSSLVFFNATNAPGVVTDGILPKMAGFQPIEAPNLPATANLVGMALVPSAAVIAMRLPSDYVAALPGAGNGTSSTVTDPDTGMSVLQVQYVNHQLGSATQRISSMFGVAVGEQVGGLLLKSQ
jgi:phage I-like protein